MPLFVFQICSTLAVSSYNVSDVQLGSNVLTELFRLVGIHITLNGCRFICDGKWGELYKIFSSNNLF